MILKGNSSIVFSRKSVQEVSSLSDLVHGGSCSAAKISCSSPQVTEVDTADTAGLRNEELLECIQNTVKRDV